MSAPIVYLVVEQRDGVWMLGDDWAAPCETIVEARGMAADWAKFGRPIGILAVSLVEEFAAEVVAP